MSCKSMLQKVTGKLPDNLPLITVYNDHAQVDVQEKSNALLTASFYTSMYEGEKVNQLYEKNDDWAAKMLLYQLAITCNRDVKGGMKAPTDMQKFFTERLMKVFEFAQDMPITRLNHEAFKVASKMVSTPTASGFSLINRNDLSGQEYDAQVKALAEKGYERLSPEDCRTSVRLNGREVFSSAVYKNVVGYLTASFDTDLAYAIRDKGGIFYNPDKDVQPRFVIMTPKNRAKVQNGENFPVKMVALFEE